MNGQKTGGHDDETDIEDVRSWGAGVAAQWVRHDGALDEGDEGAELFDINFASRNLLKGANRAEEMGADTMYHGCARGNGVVRQAKLMALEYHTPLMGGVWYVEGAHDHLVDTLREATITKLTQQFVERLRTL